MWGVEDIDPHLLSHLWGFSEHSNRTYVDPDYDTSFGIPVFLHASLDILGICNYRNGYNCKHIASCLVIGSLGTRALYPSMLFSHASTVFDI